jgi:hypothetical protein
MRILRANATILHIPGGRHSPASRLDRWHGKESGDLRNANVSVRMVN